MKIKVTRKTQPCVANDTRDGEHTRVYDMSKPKKARHPLDEWSDDDEDLKGGALSVGSFDDAYSLKVTIFWAHCPWRNVKKKEKPDPYCIVKYGGEEGETTQLSATIHPKWNEVMYFFFCVILCANFTCLDF